MTSAPLRRFYQLDEGELGTAWNIIVPGPSLERSLPDLDRTLPTIAVAGAIAAPIQPYYWAQWAAPRVSPPAWHSTLVDKAPRILTGPHGKRWASCVPDAHVVVLQHPKDAALFPPDWRSFRCQAGPSWLLAARFAILRGHAREIRFYGLDLQGEGYAYELPDTLERTPDEWEGRWEAERGVLDRLEALRTESLYADDEPWSLTRIQAPSTTPLTD